MSPISQKDGTKGGEEEEGEWIKGKGEGEEGKGGEEGGRGRKYM